MQKNYIILVNYNTVDVTIDCLSSIEKSEYQNFQLIIVDNSYNNSFLDGIQNFLYENKYSFIRFEERILENDLIIDNNAKYVLIKQINNKGFASANNIGIQYALKKNDFDSVILLNNDTVVENNTLSEVIRAKDKIGDKNIFGGKIYYYDTPNVLWYGGGDFSFITGKSKHVNCNKIENKKIQNVPMQTGFITFCFVLIPKIVIDKIGLLDESYFMYFEDLDYCYRCKMNNIGLYYIPDAHIFHKVGASSGSGISDFAAQWGYKNEIKFNRKRKDKLKYLSIAIIVFSRFFIAIRWILRGCSKKANYAITTIRKGFAEKIV